MSRSPVFCAPAVVLCLCGGVFAQPRPFLFSMGRFTSQWAGRPQSYDQQIWDHMVNIGVTVNGSGLCWCDVQPNPPVDPEDPQASYNWAAIDYADFEVNEILARGMEPTFFLGLTPAWAALHPELPPHRTPPAEEYVDEFMDFHRWVVNHFKGRVHYYTFWNEPNGCSWINDGCANGDSYPLYTQWLIRCSQAVKEVDPDAKIIAGNLDYNQGVSNGWQYIQGMYNYGAGPYFDIIAIHPYNGAGGLHWQAITDTRNVMVANGDADKTIWITEYGWDTTNYQWTADQLVAVLTELKKPEWKFVEQASYLILNGFPPILNYGLTDEDLNPRAGYYAFRDFDKTFYEYAYFTADVKWGVAPLTVQFTDDSWVIGAHTWSWEFGDNATGGGPAPQHTYEQPGLYTVRLTVTGDHGSFMREEEAYINVGVPVMVTNPSFEDPAGFLNGWSSCLGGASTIKQNPSTHVPTPACHDGTNRAGMSSSRTGDGLGCGAIYQQVSVIPGHTYRVRCWGTLTAEGGDYGNDFMELRARDGDSTPINCSSGGANIVNNSTLLAHLNGQAQTAWTLLDGTITPTQEVVTIIAYWKFSGTVWVTNSLHLDDWSMTDEAPPELVSAVSRRQHGYVGEFDIPLPVGPSSAAGVEPRRYGCQKVILTFSEMIEAADGTPDATEVSLTCDGSPCGSVDQVRIVGNKMTIELSAVPDQTCLAITLSGIQDTDDHPLAGDNDVHVRVMAGNVNDDVKTDLTDMALLKARNGWTLAPDTCHLDINIDGKIDLTDMALAKSLALSGGAASCD